jgi:hypothetical protein
MNAALKEWVKLRQEVAANTRLRVGIWAILLIVIFYGLLLQADRVSEEINAYNNQATRLEKILAIQNQEGWQTILEQEKKTTETLQTFLWQADTLGIAQASLQRALNDLLTNLKFRNIRLKFGVAKPLEGAQDVWQVQAQINAHYRKGDEVRLLHDLAAHPNKLVVDRLELHSRGPRMLLQVSAYFKGLEP